MEKSMFIVLKLSVFALLTEKGYSSNHSGWTLFSEIGSSYQDTSYDSGKRVILRLKERYLVRW